VQRRSTKPQNIINITVNLRPYLLPQVYSHYEKKHNDEEFVQNEYQRGKNGFQQLSLPSIHTVIVCTYGSTIHCSVFSLQQRDGDMDKATPQQGWDLESKRSASSESAKITV
jgi:hypothetical protein